MSERLRWGVLGCADIAIRAVLPAIRDSSNALITAIASRHGPNAADVAKQFGVPKAYGTYEALLDDPDVDAVYVPLPNSLHVPWALKAIAAGKHVLCEKPLGLSVTEVEQLWQAADGAGVLAMEALMYQYHPQTRRVQELIKGRILGDVQLVSAEFTYGLTNEEDVRLNAALGGGVLWDVGTYCVHVARTAFGSEPELVFGLAEYGGGNGVDEVFAGILKFESGMATFTCSLRGPRTQAYTVTGTAASLHCPVPFAPGTEDRSLIIRSGATRRDAMESVEVVPGEDQYRLMIEDFGRLATGEKAPSNHQLQDVRANILVLSTLLQSAKERRAIAI